MFALRNLSDVEALEFSLLLDPVENLPVAASPAVDALLDITYQHSLASRGKFLEEQLLEVLPLHSACVLELVDHHIVDDGAYLLEDEGRIAALHHLAQQSRRAAEGKAT